MQIKIESRLFEWLKDNAWGSAKENIHYFTIEEIDTIEQYLMDLQEEPWEETQINDLFWFDDETLCEWLNISVEEFDKREKQW